MTTIGQAVEEYLELRRALGHKLDDAGRQLQLFVKYLASTGADQVTTQAAVGFAFGSETNPGSSVPARRLTAVRGFARFLSGADDTTEVPPLGIAPTQRRRRVPYIFSEVDVATVVRCASASTPFAFRRTTLATIIQLLAVTGMRVGEVLRLGRHEVDFDKAVILVRKSKFTKGRDIPVARSTAQALAAYAAERDKRRPSTTFLFVSLAGTPVLYSNFGREFHRAVCSAGIAAGTGLRPRLHDLRH
jgi:integrase/recombinase XerD